MFLIRWLVVVIVFLAAAHILPGIHVKSFWVALLAAIVLSILNFFILTLGLFTFVINALMILLVSAIVPGFVVDGFLWALALAFIISVVKFLIK